MLPIQLVANMESSIALCTELTKLRCFLSWQVSSFDVIKNSHTYRIQDSANTVNEHFLNYSKCSKYLPPAFTYSLKLFLRQLCSAENLPMSSPVRFHSETVFFCYGCFLTVSSIAPQKWYRQRFKFGKLDGHCFCWIICRQFALLSDFLCAQNPLYIAKSAAPSGSSRLLTLPNQMTSVFSESNSRRICHLTSMSTLLVLSAFFNYDNYATSDVLLMTTLSLHSFMRSSQVKPVGGLV